MKGTCVSRIHTFLPETYIHTLHLTPTGPLYTSHPYLTPHTALQPLSPAHLYSSSCAAIQLVILER